MVLVCQIYAPVEELDRSLYVFGCNRRQCSLSSSGWKVIRNQKLVIANTSIVTSPNKLSAKAEENKSSAEKNTPKTNIWDFSAINLSTNSLDDKSDDLLAMIAQRDSKLKSKSKATNQKKKCKPAISSPASIKSEKNDNLNTMSVDSVLPLISEDRKGTEFPEYLLTEVDDPYIEKRKDKRERDSKDPNTKSLVVEPSMDEEDDDDEEDELNLYGAIDDRHVQELLENYMKDEDDVESLQILRQYQSGQLKASESLQRKDGDRDDLTDEQEDRFLSAVKRSTQKSSSPLKSKTNISSSLLTRDEVEMEEKDCKPHSESTRIQRQRNRVERLFHQRMALEPRQVLRYCYNSEPIWISYPHPTEEDIKALVAPCPICGQQRVYECQLMPPLLSFISSDDPTTTTSLECKKTLSDPTSDQVVATDTPVVEDLASRLGDNLDFGVVTIWSCPNSCFAREGSGNTMEVVIVQPPPDI